MKRNVFYGNEIYPKGIACIYNRKKGEDVKFTYICSSFL